jgi:hypothetical protein
MPDHFHIIFDVLIKHDLQFSRIKKGNKVLKGSGVMVKGED